MRFAWLMLAVVLPAHADLYRWVDPATGSVKFSSLPPTDGSEADVVRYKEPAPLPKPGAPLPPKPAVAAPASSAELEGRWRGLLTQLMGLTPQDFTNGGTALRQQLEAYEAVRSELDRLDPGGASRRAAEATSMIERLRQR